MEVHTAQEDRFISYYPLKQGLKLITKDDNDYKMEIFISYYPLKQGLKLSVY